MNERYISFCGDICIGDQQYLDPALAKDAAINFLIASPESGNVTFVFRTTLEAGLDKPSLESIVSVHVRFDGDSVNTYEYAQVNHA